MWRSKRIEGSREAVRRTPVKGINDTVVKRLKPLIQDGQFVLLHGPGLGITFNEEVARAHLKPGYTFSEQGKKAVNRALS